MLGSGDAALESGFSAGAKKYPGSVSVRLTYDEALAHRIIAGSDVLLVPSRFEPCGLTQMYALAYGSLPLVNRVGGLADTVRDVNAEHLAAGDATGFVFTETTASGLRDAINRAFALWTDTRLWSRVQHSGMLEDFGWAPAAKRYLDLYHELRPLA